MYGLWLFKELRTEYGYCKVEVFRKGYTASAVEIGGFVGNSLNLALENLDTITAPIGKSVCSFSIYDTDQVEYDDLFTPDATAYKVVISTKVDGGEYNTRWSGYVTPDFFAENLSFRTPISISARDNIGYLNDVDFDLDTATITVRELIQAAFRKIAEDYPMSLSFVTQKQTAEGILAIDATISTYLLREMSWYEALETILHDLGLQMRWVDNNTIAVLDISQLGENFGLQRFNFIESSGYREILPAWRELSQKQDYGLRENFFEGWMSSNKLSFAKTQSLNIPDLGFRQDVRYYQPTNWGVARDIYTTDPAFYNTAFGKRLFFSAVSETYPDTTYLSWSTNILKSNVPLLIKCKALNTVIYPFGGYTPYPLQLKQYDPFLTYGAMEGDHLQIGLKLNLFLHARDNKTYVMNKDWVEDDGTGSGSYINLTLDKVSLDSYNYIAGKGFFPVGAQPQEQELTITANTIPYDGTLELRIYGYYVVSSKYGNQNIQSPNFEKFFTYIDELTYTFDGNEISSGQESKVQVSELHNIKEDRDYSFGQVPLDCGGINAYAGGLFKANGDELVGFRRNVDSTTYPLLELVGREIIHFNKKNYNKLSGTIKNLAKEPLRFDRMFNYRGKNYLPFACSLDVISNTMNVTTMQEVEPYITHSFVEIKSELVTGGGATVSGGNNTALQYSAEVGNAKRISELNNASESEKKESYIIVDNASWNESKKVPLSEMEGLNETELTEFLTANKYATQPWVSGIAKGLADDIANRVLVADFEKLEGTVNGNYQSINILNGKVGTLEGYFTKGVANDSAKLGGQLPSYYATASALGTTNSNLSALTTRVGNAEGAITSIQNTYVDKASAQTITGVKTFQNGLQIGDAKLVWDSATNALKIIGSAYTTGTFGMGDLGEAGSGGGGAAGIVTVRVNGYDYNSVNGIVTLPDYPTSLPASDVYSWAKAATKPTYTASEVGALSVSGGTIYGSLMISNASGAIILDNNSNGNYGYLTYQGGVNWSVTDSGWGASYAILHEGNYSNYALPLSGGTMNGDLTIGEANNSAWKAINFNRNGTSAFLGINSVNELEIGFHNGYLKVSGASFNYTTPSGNYTVLHSGNYSSYALPLSGGILKSGAIGVLQIESSHANMSALYFLNGSSQGGYFGVDGNGSFFITDTNWNVHHNLIHSGNIGSQSVNYANGAFYASRFPCKRDIGFDANSNESLLLSDYGSGNPRYNQPDGFTYGSIFTPLPSNGETSLLGQFAWDINHDTSTPTRKLWFRASNNLGWGNDWKTIAFTDSNVASATKLQTARTIWGQSFDGSGDVTAPAKMQYLEFANVGGDAIGYVGKGANSADTLYIGTYGESNVYLFSRYPSSSLILKPSGNVLIGATEDSGQKLQVNGGVKLQGFVDICEQNTSNVLTATIYGNIARIYAYDGVNNAYRDLYLGQNSANALTVKANGSILMGSTTDNGYKLQVDGYITTTLGILGMSASTYNRWNITHGSNTLYFQSGLTDGSGTKGNVLISGINTHDLTSFGVNATVSTFNGNVLIGTTSDSGYKLQVNGAGRFGAAGDYGIVVGAGSNAIDGIYNTSYGSAPLYLNYYSSGSISICNGGGNTLIGTIINDGYKLNINGSVQVKAGDYIANRATLILNSNSGNAADIIFKCNSTIKGNFGWWAISSRNDSTGRFSIWRGEENGINPSEAEVFIIDAYGNLTATGDIISEGTIAMAKLASSSDRKLKENIKWLSADKSMEVVRALRPTEWNWKKDGTHSFGFIAQDIQPIIPEMVSSVNDTLRLEYNQLHAFEIGAIQHIDNEVETLKKDLKTANNRIEVLENELNKYRRTAQWQ